MTRFQIDSSHDLSPSHPAPTGPTRLAHSAHEFEASLMAELLKPLQSGMSDTADGSEGALAGFASESLAKAISERGGFGIADRILHQLAPAVKHDPTQVGSVGRAR